MGTDRLRILVSTPVFLPLVGGAELGIHEIYDRLGTRHDVTILTPTVREVHKRNYGSSDYGSTNYEVRRLTPALDSLRPAILGRAAKRTFLPYLFELWRYARREHVDVVNFHYLAPHGFALIALRYIGGVPALLSLVGRSDVVSTLSWPMRLHARSVVAASNLVAPVSTFYLRDSYLRSKARVIPYGADTERFAPSERSLTLRHALGIRDGQLMLLTVQRLAPVKRVDVLLHVAAALRGRAQDAVLVIGGQGEERPRLARLADQLGVSEVVRFCGYIPGDQLPAYFGSADLFVFHSLFETFGLVFAQAMAAGLPIVAASSSCVPDVVKADNGILVRPFDVGGFADAVVRLAADPARRAAISERNRQRAVETFDWNRIADQYEQALAELAHDRPVR
jgi:glycosyltransferase involved in cell wall biosynthesis